MTDLTSTDNLRAFAAVAALILSQFPPLVPALWRWSRGGAVRVSTRDSFAISHGLGRIYVTLYAQLQNTGAATATVERIDCIIRRVATGETRPRKTVWRFPAQAYYAEPKGSRVFIGTIPLKPGEIWQEVTHCYGIGSQDEEEREQYHHHAQHHRRRIQVR